eukprot:CAMPEP_0174739774 /NCGR_PEP_ID=MMETSP1094-20130205/72163_1 /TAXON_ID=156173 /ORGANISM="Chrysochromulina brevifilum, Strain UTEX LB 985" /LENGTH=35 /DNA_ID= /DNA_START= /DNA_END= /DNA_ORIENTATION=
MPGMARMLQDADAAERNTSSTLGSASVRAEEAARI